MSRGILSAVCHVPERKRMEFTEGLKKNIDFGKVYRKGKSRANRQLVLYILSNGTDKNRLGISVSKKVGNSVVRHRVKRLIKEAYRLNESAFARGYDLVFIARTDAAGKTYEEIEKSVLHISDLMGISI
jgi:ribonuclease P protein component